MSRGLHGKIIFTKNMSYNELESLLTSDSISLKVKEKIIGWLHEKQIEIDKEVDDYFSNKKRYGILNFYTVSNDVWRLARYQLFREGHHLFSCKGTDCRERIICDDESVEVARLIFDKAREIKDQYFWSRSRIKGKHPNVVTIDEMADALSEDKD